ncbi:MAG: response regulator transcription factor [Geodermatophilaceae bacterium]|nr:response regulator transcription factor [Geodermatophilaceae bacterium]
MSCPGRAGSSAGAPADEIASRTAPSPGTVRNYLSSAVGKVGATNRHEAVQIAQRHGWI